jgi:putative transposase
MKKSEITEQQIAFALRQAETDTKVKAIVRQMGITESPSVEETDPAAAPR